MVFSTKTFAIAAALGAFTAPALAQTEATPWELKPSGPYLEGDGKFKFGPDQ